MQAAFRSDVKTNRPLPDESTLRLDSESEPGKGGALLTFWEQYPISTPREVLEWAKVNLQGEYTQQEAGGEAGEGTYGSSPIVAPGSTRDSRIGTSASHDMDLETFTSDDAEISRQLHMEETWGIEDSPVHGPEQGPGLGRVSRATSETVASRLGVPLEFQRLYVW